MLMCKTIFVNVPLQKENKYLAFNEHRLIGGFSNKIPTFKVLES